MYRDKSVRDAYHKAYRAANKERLNAASAAWREANKHRIRDMAKAAKLKHTYGITVEQYQALFESQSGVCAICGKPPGKLALAVDHCHATGRIRGLLCTCCNHGLGMFRDCPINLSRAIEYLR
jgi:hypothetical protein